MMSAHKITAGHGYTYLTSQVAAQDAGAVPPGGLGAYYAEHGEAPGRWLGSGHASLAIEPASTVREDQMIALFGEGRHPDATAIRNELAAKGADDETIDRATALGRPFELNLANNEYLRQVAQLSMEWNRLHGNPDCTPLPAPIRARIRTMVATTLFESEHGREPRDPQELSGYVAAQSRVGSRAVAGFDLTFSPVKSVSALWALADPRVAKQVEAAHAAAVADTIGWLERTAVFTRLGRNGVRQVDTRGLIAAAFVHRTSRAGDPDLHTHVAVSNKVQTTDGRWRALDGRVLLKATVAASERYNTRLEAELRARLGVRFVERARRGRRPTREIAGVDERLITEWSSRRWQINQLRAELGADFLAEHGRPPTPVESIELAQQATLQTRPDKLRPTAESVQRERWREEATRVVGAQAIRSGLGGHAARPAPSSDQLRDIAHRVVATVQSDRATWQQWHVIAEAQRELRRLELPVAELDRTLDRIVQLALGEYSIALTRPELLTHPELQRADGESVYRVAGSQLYTSSAVLASEQSVLGAAARFGGLRVDETTVELALLESAANGLTLNEGQASFVRDFAQSGARCQLALAPAGTGKTTALRVLTRAWRETGGDVVTLAPSAAAAHVLGEATDTPADTLAKAITELDRGERRLTNSTLVIVDEAGMAGTPDLARLTEHALAAGASVRLVGDDRQLAAVGAGGLLRDIAETRGAVRLSEAVRFADPGESDAAAALRTGSADALDYYTDAGRVHVGDEHTVAESAYAAWIVDRQSGLDSVLLAATREQVSALNARARADRLAREGAPSVEVRLADGSSASAGDSIVTKHNDRRLGITATDWVKNGDRWTVNSVREDGAITATHCDTGRHVVLPADYVAAHVALGYATTIHSAQGATADSSHTVISGTETREQLYVAMTRGRFGNHVHVALPGAADDHAAVRADTLIPPSALDLLRRVLDRDDSARSATTEQRVGGDPVRQLREAVARYIDSVALAPAAVDESSAPLPWLPPVPRCVDERWRAYLDQRAAQIVQLADRVVRDLAARSSPARPARTEQSHRVLWQLIHSDSRAALTEREHRYLLAQRQRQAPTRARSPIEAGSPHLDGRYLSR